MPIDQHNFLGATDTDSPDHVIGRGFHRECRNGQFRGMKGNKRLENISSTVARANPFLPSTGINKNLNLYYDAVNYRIISFNYNSGGLHGIYVFYTLTKTWFTLIQIGSTTDGDILGFTTDMITSVNIVYNDVAGGNLLCFLDCLGRPTCFSIERFLNNPYTLIKRAYIDMAKAPPSMPPKCVYENDYNVSINNLNNALFQFKERWVYDDSQKSVYSTGSKVPLPWNNIPPFNPANGYIPDLLNARIRIYVQTGDADVAKIEIWGRQATDTTATVNANAAPSPDYFLIVSLDKAQLGIPDNSVYQFLFYNDGAYNFGDIKEETQLFDSVPIFAAAQDALNGNVIAYGDTTEGYPNTPIDGALSTENVFLPPHNILNGALFLAAVNGTDSGGIGQQIQMFITGVSQNDGSGNPMFLEYNGITFFVNVQKPDGTDLSFQFTSTTFVIADMLAGLAAAAVTNGFTVVSTGTNSLVVSYPSNVVIGSSPLSFTAVGAYSVNDTIAAYATRCAYDLAIQYYDEKGRTPGAQPFTNNPLTTAEDLSGTLIPSIDAVIRSRPPIWAVKWQLLRSDNLTYVKRVGWVSNQTFTNTDLNTEQKYAYIGISNFDQYNQNIEASTNVVSYQFQQGDRIRFEIRYPVGTAQQILTGNLDYDITSVEPDPIINGVIQKGTFIKIVSPSNVSAGFQFGGEDFQRYKVLIYNYAQQVARENVTYHEFGECYGIGNAGTTNAFHLAPVQTQSADLTTPAKITTLDGDLYFRQRNVPTGMIYYPTVGNTAHVDPYSTLSVAFDTSPIVNSSYTLTTQLPQAGAMPFVFYHNTSAFPQRLRLTAEFTAQAGANKQSSISILVFTGPAVNTPAPPPQFLVKNFYMGLGENIQTYDVPYDGYVSIPAGYYASLDLGKDTDTGTQVRSGSYVLKLEFVDNVPISIIDFSFSDKYNIITNSDSRPSIYDINAAQINYPVRFRWGLADILSTNINNINRFYFQDYDEFDLSHGSIVRIRARQKEARIFQQRRCGRVGVYNKFLRDNQGQNTLVSTDVIITQNNIQYYEGEWGIGNQPSSLISSGYADYFADPVRGNIIRLSLDGLVNISLLYRVQNWAGDNVTPFLSATPYQFGGNNAIVGSYNFTKDKESEAIFCLQGNESFAFNESENTWTAFYDYVPDAITCAENVLYSAYNGVLYSHDGDTYCNFYGTQYKPWITPVYNDFVENKKTWIGIAQPSNVPWISPLIYTEMMSYGTQRQESNLVTSDFKLLETEWSTSFKRDIKSIGGVANGKTLKGGYIVIQMTVEDGSQYVFLLSPKVKFINSPLNAT